MTKILILENKKEITRDYLGYLKDYGYKLFDLSDSFDDQDIFGLIFRSGINIDQNVLDKYKNVKFVFRVGVGLDNVDLDLCKSRGILVLNSQGSNSDSVADLALWGTLSLLRKTKNITNKNDIDKNRFEYMGSELGKQNVAMLGFGAIGKKIYQRLKGFGIDNFLLIDPFVSKTDLTEYEYCKKYESLEKIGKQIDILYISLPLNLDTKGYLDRNILSRLKSNLKIINISRLGVINTDDLYEFVSKNTDSGLFMDIEINNLKSDIEMFSGLDNCIITPHIGAMTDEANEKMHKFDVNKILDL